MRRVYATYDRDDLSAMSLEHVACLMNARTRVNVEIACFRNRFGDLFELNVDTANGRILVYTASGGVSLGVVSVTDDTVAESLWDVEKLADRWTEGFVCCADCGVEMRRFTPQVAGAYHAGRYCDDCAPKYERLNAMEVD
jgi:hypothetical protein